MLVSGKRVLVTGGTGSLGEVLIRRLLGGSLGRPESVTVFSRDEAKQHSMRLEYLRKGTATEDIIFEDSSHLLKFRIGDVRDYDSLRLAVQEADLIFHAAALKQVPTCEYFPFEAVQTNIEGAHNLAKAVRECGTPPELVVGISTDKACKPINVMGMTKAIQERVLTQANLDSPGTRFVCVRYGNVIASRGSVVPLFIEQIAKGGPVTVTLKEMTRFLLPLEKAVDTVLTAAESALPGETYVPRVPSALVMDIVEVLTEGTEIEVVFTGIRPGEKIHEIMVSEEECHRTVARGDYYVIQPILPELRHTDDNEDPLDSEYSSAKVTLSRADLAELISANVPSAVV